MATAITALALILGGAGRAKATFLLDLEDPPSQTNMLYTLPFTATAGTTTITIEGTDNGFKEDVTNPVRLTYCCGA
jgi:hypothetical protein